MIIGIPKEIKEGEYRVSAVPAVVESLAHAGHEALVETETVAGTSTYALTNATSRYILQIANLGWKQALAKSLPLRKGLNIAFGRVTLPAIAELFGIDAVPVEDVLTADG